MSPSSSIAELAYRLWIERGRPHGSAEEDWLEAERQLSAEPAPSGHRGGDQGMVDASSQDSFPASDPPANHQPDVLPSNAAEKWRAAGGRGTDKKQSSTKRP